MDPERRATYDALAGFSASSINPFADTSLPADQVFVDEYTCIGCRNCTNVCPKCVVNFCQQHAGSACHCLCSCAAVWGVAASTAQHSTAQRSAWPCSQYAGPPANATLAHTLLQQLHRLSPGVRLCRTFAIEDDFGRARVMQQGVDADDKLQEAIDTCPVNCIYWVRPGPHTQACACRELLGLCQSRRPPTCPIPSSFGQQWGWSATDFTKGAWDGCTLVALHSLACVQCGLPCPPYAVVAGAQHAAQCLPLPLCSCLFLTTLNQWQLPVSDHSQPLAAACF